MIVVPFHQDTALPEGTLPVPAGVTVATDLPAGDRWPRLVALWDAVAATVAADPAPVVVSGDCLVALGVVAGVQRAGADPAIVWFDAHGDVHTLESSTSGYLGGLALRLVLGAHADRVAEPLGLRPIPERRAVLVDARDLDPAEADYLAASDLRHCPVTDVEPPDGPLVLHVDVDVIDSAELPGLLFPAPDGPSTATVVTAVRRIVATGRVAALSIACPWHPTPTEGRRDLIEALAMRFGVAGGPTVDHPDRGGTP
ncbi:MAG: arginase family protein [Actinophytocola sp.]|uniref:arginase family protein n=1 Tax=Actinophytocola sp. TaxID=1872138 RepID=UPI00132165E0|nr:arginase family protein [Actinophytocola sp.]MPZ80274.1 arginase family protein [Actinophytocola sp.]